MLFLSLTAQAVATSPPEYWLSSQYQALRNGRQRFLRPPTCGGLSNPVVNAAFRCPGEARLQTVRIRLRNGASHARVGTAAAHVLSFAISALASSKSLRMTAVIATFGGLPALHSWRYFRARSGLHEIAETAGM